MNHIRQREIDWYRKNGKFPERIVTDSDGLEYVIGDFSWNRNKPCFEYIEPDMRQDGVYDPTPQNPA